MITALVLSLVSSYAVYNFFENKRDSIMILIKGGENMPNIKPISDLRNYSAVLEDVTVGSPVYLTKNGHGCYTIMDINEQEEMSRKARKYDKMVAELEVMKMLNEGLASANEEGWIDEDSMRSHFKERFENE